MNFGYVVSICIILMVKHFEAPIERLPCCWPWRPQGSCGGIPFERLRCTSGATVRNLDIACWAVFFVDNQADNSKFRAAWAAVHLRVSKCFNIIFLFRGPFLFNFETDPYVVVVSMSSVFTLWYEFWQGSICKTSRGKLKTSTMMSMTRRILSTRLPSVSCCLYSPQCNSVWSFNSLLWEPSLDNSYIKMIQNWPFIV